MQTDSGKTGGRGRGRVNSGGSGKAIPAYGGRHSDDGGGWSAATSGRNRARSGYSNSPKVYSSSFQVGDLFLSLSSFIFAY